MFGWFRRAPPVPPHSSSASDNSFMSLDLTGDSVSGRASSSTPVGGTSGTDSKYFYKDLEVDTAGLDHDQVDINVAIAEQVHAEMTALMNADGGEWDAGRRMAYMLRRAVEIQSQVTMLRHISDEMQYMTDTIGGEIRGMSAQLLARRHETSLDQLAGIVRNHPFLAGMVGAQVVYNVKKLLHQQ